MKLEHLVNKLGIKNLISNSHSLDDNPLNENEYEKMKNQIKESTHRPGDDLIDYEEELDEDVDDI